MLLTILLIAAGASLAAFAFSRKSHAVMLKISRKLRRAAVSLLLLAIWALPGVSPDFPDNIETMGSFGFLFAASTVAGSVLFIFLLSRLLPGWIKNLTAAIKRLPP